MIAATIGKKFLKAYNHQHDSAYTAKDFFTQEYFPLFFDKEKYMQWVTNSPFVQGIKKGVPPSALERKQKLQTLVRQSGRCKHCYWLSILRPYCNNFGANN